MTDLAAGEKLGRFLIERKLGKGASGVVYLAEDTGLSQKVALKVLHPWLLDVTEVRERFKREIVLTRRIVASGVCRIHDLHEIDDQTFVTMEFIEGQTLSELIHVEGRQTPQRTLEILRGLTPPLAAAHKAGVVHRDLKPGNIMIRADGSVCVLDFGMATASDVTRITQAGRTVGSLRFIAPEVWQGDPATPQSDLYAAGVVLYATMAGRLPYEAKTPAEAFAAQKQGPPSLLEHNAAVTPSVDAVVKKAMARVPGDRYASIEELCHAFDRAVQNEEATSSTGTVIVRPRDAQDPENVRLTPMKSPTGDVFAHTESKIPLPALIAAGVVGVVVIVAVVAAIALGGTTSSVVDAGVRHMVAHDPAIDAKNDDAKNDDAKNDDTKGEDTKGEDAKNEDAPSSAPSRPSSSKKHGAVKVSEPEPSFGSGSLGAAMKKRGLLPGDVPAIDALAAKARKLEAQGKSAEAASTSEKARELVNKTPIDRGFISAKQKRLSFLVDRAPASSQAKLAQLQSDVEKLVVQREYAAANEKLNRAFALVR